MNSDLAFVSSFLNEGIYVVREKTILTKEQPSSIKQPDDADIRYKGKNLKKTIILVDYPNHESIIPKDVLILDKILSSVGHTTDDTALINLSANSIDSVHDIFKNVETENLIAFGIPRHFWSDFGVNKTTTFMNHKLLFCSENLTSLAMNRDAKALLWHNLKIMFGL